MLLLLMMTVWISTGSHRHSLFWWTRHAPSLFVPIYEYIFVLISMGGIRQNIQIFWWTHKRKSNISSRVYIQQYEKARCIFLLHSDNEVSEVRWTANIPVLEYTDGDIWYFSIPIVVVAWVTDSPTDACTPPHVHHASCRMNSLDYDEIHFVYRWVMLDTASDSFYEKVILWSITSKNNSTIDNRVLQIGIRNWRYLL